MSQMSRRSFILSASAVAVTGLASSALPVYASSSFQPSDYYPIPTAPKSNDFNLKLQLVAEQNDKYMTVGWEIASDSEFKNIINKDSITLEQDTEQALNIVLHNVGEETSVFYRLNCENCDAYEISELPFEQGINISNLALVSSSKIQQ